MNFGRRLMGERLQCAPRRRTGKLGPGVERASAFAGSFSANQIPLFWKNDAFQQGSGLGLDIPIVLFSNSRVAVLFARIFDETCGFDRLLRP